MKRITSICGALMVAMIPSLAAEPIIGRATVTDGDTIEIRDTRIRLFGIDAPEGRQTCQDENGADYRCGQRAAFALADFIGTKNVSCEPVDRDRYGRIVARCFVGNQDVGAWMVANGHALAFRRYSSDYVDEEDVARAMKRGMWRGEFAPPWEWRDFKR